MASSNTSVCCWQMIMLSRSLTVCTATLFLIDNSCCFVCVPLKIRTYMFQPKWKNSFVAQFDSFTYIRKYHIIICPQEFCLCFSC